MLASLSGSPRFLINDGQAQVMGDAIAEFSKYFPITPSGKNGAIMGLCAACAMVYTPMVIGLASDARAARKPKPQAIDPLMPAAPATPDNLAPRPAGGAYNFAGI